MMRAKHWRSVVYLGAAAALYAWRAYERRQRGVDRADVSPGARPGDGPAEAAGEPPHGGARPEDRGDGIDAAGTPLQRDDHGAAERGETSGHAATGITGLPPDAEAEQQRSLPPRGARKDTRPE